MLVGMNAARPRVRVATADDFSEVLRLAEIMYESIGMDTDTPGWRNAAYAMLAERLGRDAAVFVADHPDEPGRLVASGAGSIATRFPGPANLTGRVGYIQWVATEAAWRHRGLARAIMTALLDWYRALEVTMIELHASSDGEPLYRSLGFDEGAQPGFRFRLT